MSVYACSDLHGRYDLCKQILDFLQPEDTLYFLGDAIDRGSESFKTMTALLNDKRVIYLMGNHEDFFIEYIPALLDGNADAYVWWCNGGYSTWEDTCLNTNSNKEVLNLVAKLKKLPKRIDYINIKGQKIILTHAGTDPDRDEREWALYGVKDAYIWNRKHFFRKWNLDDPEIANTYVVHGHTPTPYLEEELFGQKRVVQYCGDDVHIVQYCDGHKFDIDCGAYATGVAALINLDTFEVKYFKEKA